MKIFEFHFNPDAEKELIFDTFCYEPANIYERRLGALFMIGEVKNILPQNMKLLDKITLSIKKEYYYKFQRTNELALKEALKQSNEMLSAEVSKNNTTWLGNLGFAILSLKNYDLNFTKIGGVKLFLLRGPHVIDIGEKLDSQEIEPYPLKIFNNIVSGKLAENDIILAITPEVLPIFKGLLDDIAKISPFDEKKFSELIKTRENQFSDLSGCCFLISLTKESLASFKKPKIVFQKEAEVFSFKKAMMPAKNGLETISSYFKKFTLPKKQEKKIENIKIPEKTEKIQKTKVKIPVKALKREPVIEKKKIQLFKLPKINIRFPKLRIPIKLPVITNINLPNIKIPKKIKLPKPVFKITSKLKKTTNLVMIMMFFLTIGFFFSQGQEKKQLEEYGIILNSAQEKIDRAESFLLLRDTDTKAIMEANSLFLEAWDLVSPLTKLSGKIKNQALPLLEKIENNLGELNNLIKIDEPEIIFQFDSKEFIPQKMISDGKNLYLFSPYVNNIFKINEAGQGETINTDLKFNSGSALSSDSALIFSKPNNVLLLKNGQIDQAFSLKNPYINFNFTDFTSFKEVLYFLDNSKGEIIRYPALPQGTDNPQLWLFRNAQKPQEAKSMAVDGSVWILDNSNSLLRYHSGQLQQTITVKIFPEPKGFSKIFITPILPYIFILEPINQRLIVLDKTGLVFEQFQSPEFDNLLDISTSQDGRTIFILNGLKVYKISL